MQVMMLYGPPGVGKLTTAKELAALTGYKLLHNHLTVDLVTALFPRDSKPWFRLLRQVRQDVYAEAVKQEVNLVVTSVFRGVPGQVAAAQKWVDMVRESGGQVLFVRLSCDREELMVRVQSEGRAEINKLTDPVKLAAEMEQYDMGVVMLFEPTLFRLAVYAREGRRDTRPKMRISSRFAPVLNSRPNYLSSRSVRAGHASSACVHFGAG